MFPEIGEALHYQQAARFLNRYNFFVLQNPGIAVRHEHGVDSSRQRGIDIGLGTISNHPRGVRWQRVFGDYFSIRCGIFLRDDLYG